MSQSSNSPVRLFSGLAKLAEAASARMIPGRAPRVLIVPGLPGTSLGRPGFPFDDRVWFDAASVFAGRLTELAVTEPPGPRGLEALGVLDAVYLQLQLRLQCAGYDAAFHPFDWRRSLDELGPELAARIRAEEREVHLVTHSFGGLVARAAIAAGAPGVGKVIMLGAPNHGTFAAVQGIRGTHWALRLLSAIDPVHTAQELGERVFSTWPSIYEQLPTRVRSGEVDLYDPRAWPMLGPAPRPGLLERAPAIQERIAQARGRFVVIAGYGVPTVDSAYLRDGVFHYRESTDGDGWVPVDLAVLDEAPRYFVHGAHIGLPNHGEVIAAVEDLLAGDTCRLPVVPPTPTRITEHSDADLPAAPCGGRKGLELTVTDMEDALDQFFGTRLVVPT